MDKKIKGKDLLAAVSKMDSGEFLKFATLNKSKKSPFAFKELLEDLNADEIHKMWEELSKTVLERMKIIIDSSVKGSPNKKESTTKKTTLEICHIVQAAIDLASVSFEQSMPVPQGLLLMIVFLNHIILEIPNDLENLKNSIALICEKMFHLNYLIHDNELIIFNIVIYLIKRSLVHKKENDVKRIYALRSVIPKIINMKQVDSNEVWSLYKQCAASPLYLSKPEGHKIISLFLTLDIDRVSEIHNVIKRYLPSTTVMQGVAYGKVYFDAWSNAVKTKNETLKNELELTCIQDLILLTVNGRQRSLVLVVRKLLDQFHNQKRRIMCPKCYIPYIDQLYGNSNGLIRANTAQLFLDVFPLEDPDLRIVDADAELNEQMILIKDLLLDDFRIVRSVTIIGLCIAMSVHWELFPETGHTERHAGSPHPPITSAQEDRHCEVNPAKRYNHIMDYNSGNGHVCSTPNIRSYGATTFAAVWAVSTVSIILASLDNTAYKETETLMLKTYFQIIINLSCDSSSVVRCAIAKGFKVLLENPLTIPTLRVILPRLKPLFHDISDPVRIAFCQLLLRVKNIPGIKYYDIVPLDHLLARMEIDSVVAKTIVNLIHNSYFPKDEKAENWLGRCVEMIREDRAASRIFFRLVPNFIDLDITARFMIQVVKTIHFYVKCKEMSNKKNDNSYSVKDAKAMEKGIGLHDPSLVSGLFDASAIMWISSLATLKKPENKNILKITVAKLSKFLGDLAVHYRDTPVWQSAFYLSSLMPSRYIPSLPSLCFARLKGLDSSAKPEDYMILLECLCNCKETPNLLTFLKEGINEGFLSSPKYPLAKKRKSKENSDDKSSTKHILAVHMLTAVLDHRSCQKAIMRNPEALKEFLDFIDYIKSKIEVSRLKTLSDDDNIFIPKLLTVLLQISVLLHTEGKLASGKFVEDVILWMQEKLFKYMYLDVNASLSKSLNTNRKRSLNASTSRSPAPKKKQSPEFQKFLVKICKDVCQTVADMTLLGYFNRTSLQFLKFGLKMLDLECGGMLFLPASKLLFNHVSYGVYLTLEEKEISLLKILPDCFNKFIQCLNEDIFLKSVPSSDTKEIQSLLAGSLLLMRSHAMLKDLVSSITFTVTKNILNSILNSIDNWDDIEKKCNPFLKVYHFQVWCVFANNDVHET
ncbi:condensin-2 complex subunit G2 [Trichonephila clavipes]|nr:condensin-2 complex subunit G2 [Trichonephila clavipes]